MKIDEIARKLKVRARNRGAVSTIDEVIQEFRLSRRDALEVLKILEREGLGRYVVGRGSTLRFKTRIEWFEAQPNQPQMQEASLKSQDVLIERSVLLSRKEYEYVFPLDDGLDVVLSLPRRLVKQEIQRISGSLVRTLEKAAQSDA